MTLRRRKLTGAVNSPIPGGVFNGEVRIKEFSVNDAGQLSVSGVLEGVATVAGVSKKVKHQELAQ